MLTLCILVKNIEKLNFLLFSIQFLFISNRQIEAYPSEINILAFLEDIIYEDNALPMIRQSQDSYQPSQRQLQRQLPRSIMLIQVPNQLRLSEEAIQSDNPRR
ncbi:Hypothetical_protein [Hexamita inflata]|uniref:Hypothetical_protein n=1 Tax=Hexamita inflata TaxID=28002 RepID=A0AA86NIN2_9EUKA|nr:Hypothetical protein HINF_LOCUS7648 [Hexamita inflata]